MTDPYLSSAHSPLRPIITIDGPAGAGKSSIAQGVAQNLGVPVIDSGALYRIVGLLADRQLLNFDVADEVLIQSTKDLMTDLVFDDQTILFNDEDISIAIRSPHISQLTSKIAQSPVIRNIITDLIRHWVTDKTYVVEGRDIGTVVLPNAFIKIYLTASDEIRAQRRYQQWRTQHPEEILDFHSVLLAQRERDDRDKNRVTSPARPAPDALIIDTSQLTIKQAIEYITQLYYKKMQSSLDPSR